MHSGKKWAALIKPGLGLVLWVCSQPLVAQLTSPEVWQSEIHNDQPLVGAIWSSADQALISTDELDAVMRSSRYLLLGEKHDNPDHHLLQRRVLAHLMGRRQVANVTFEMMDSTVRERLLDIDLQPAMSNRELKTYLMWDEEGWDWDFYGPLVEMTYRARVPLSAGNIPRGAIDDIYAGADGSFVSADEQVLDDATLEQLHLAIDESHCGMLPESQFPAMVRVQQARDRAMANAMRVPEAGMTSILIAGHFHVRRDLGVPNYLLRREPSMSPGDIVSLAFLEVNGDSENPADYLESAADMPEYDYIWFTPAVKVDDYCASLR